MILLNFDWHPFFSYEWWRDIGTGLLTFASSLLIGGSTVWVATRSYALSRKAREDHYEELLRESVTVAVAHVLEFARADRDGGKSIPEVAFDALASLKLLHAVARADDRSVTKEAIEALNEALKSTDEIVSSYISGTIAGVLSDLPARQKQNAGLVTQLKSAKADAEAHVAAEAGEANKD